MDYARGRSGPHFTELMKEADFNAALTQSRWSLYPLGVAMVSEMFDSFLRAAGYGVGGFAELAAEAFDRHTPPACIAADTWTAARAALIARAEQMPTRPGTAVKDIPFAYSRAVFDALPFHDARKSNDFELVQANLRSNLLAMHENLAARTTPAHLAALLAGGAPNARVAAELPVPS
ncbi:MAG: hypothetical protein AB1592_10635 [Pseudomonadota bacterium]